MTNEIKEILNKIKNVANKETASRNALMEMKDTDYQLLLDYITNLQEENERLNNIIKDIKSQLDYLETYSSKEDVFEDMKRRLDRIENIVNRK